jgi:ABC-type transport system substrate-binding protein
MPKPPPSTPPRSRRRRALLVGGLTGGLTAPALATTGANVANPAAGPKVLRVMFNSAETSFDPARISDLYSRTVTSHIFESLYGYDHLARPAQVVPRLADGMPEHNADFTVWTVKLKTGIVFADDPVFRGKPRPLVAADVVYGFLRSADPANKSPFASEVIGIGFRGLAARRKAAQAPGARFDYDTPVEGLQVVDAHTLRFVLDAPRPRFVTKLTFNSILPAQAREVVEHYGETIGEHPVGTGPFRLQRWVRGSKIVLARNPQYRDVRYTAQPAAGDADGQALLARFKGRRLPMVDQVEVSIIEENQPQWLSFLNGEIDALVANAGSVPLEFAPLAVPNGKLAPNLARRGVQLHRNLRADSALLYFNMDDPVVGGLAPEKVALRRALSLAYDATREIRLVRRGQAVPAQSPVMPGTRGYDPAFRSSMSAYDPARARALLDLYGYVDKDGDGFRELPDGRPLVLQMSTEPEQIYRLFNDVWRRCLIDIGVRCDFKIAQWPTNLKSAQGGTLQMWMLGDSAAEPDGQDALRRWYGPESGQGNLARFRLPAFDAIMDRMQSLPDGPERDALFLECKKLAAAYMPYKVLVHRIANELLHPWVSGYRRAPFWNDWWHMVDVDPSLRAAHG